MQQSSGLPFFTQRFDIKRITRIMWDGFLSKPVLLCSGVRQGGILSAPFFSIYVNGLFQNLESSRLGCFIEGFCVNSLMHADDLIIIALTVSDLQKMLTLCHSFFTRVTVFTFEYFKMYLY